MSPRTVRQLLLIALVVVVAASALRGRGEPGGGGGGGPAARPRALARVPAAGRALRGSADGLTGCAKCSRGLRVPAPRPAGTTDDPCEMRSEDARRCGWLGVHVRRLSGERARRLGC